MNDDGFLALSELLRLRAGPAQEVSRLVIVEKMATPDAARQVGLEYKAAHQAVKRAKRGIELVQRCAEGLKK